MRRTWRAPETTSPRGLRVDAEGYIKVWVSAWLKGREGRPWPLGLPLRPSRLR